ncbi:MAG: LamG domain-containing protein, partial [Planctomycetaceae bacterium]|nr:LamG domain-containing protein [Planctomycetaceae bacterium]
VINDFTGDGIHISGTGGNTIEGNIIGLRPDGTGVIGGANSYWNTNGMTDSAIGANDLTLFGGAGYVDGVVGQGLQFDGVDDYATTTVTMTPSFSVSVWARSETAAWNELGWIASDRSANGFIIHPQTGSGTVTMYVMDSSGTFHSIGGASPADKTQWHLYTMTYDAEAGQGKVFLDGVLTATTNTVIARETSTSTVYFGKDDGSIYPTTRFGNGAIDEPMIFSRVLSEAEVAALHAVQAGGHSPTLTSQVAYLQAEGNADDTRGLVTFTPVGTVSYTSGVVGQSFSQSGTGNYLQADSTELLSSDTVTYTSWFRTSDAGYQRLFGRQFANGQGWDLQMHPDGTWHLRVDTNTATNQGGAGTPVVNDNQWHFIAVTLDGATNTVGLSVDGGAFSSWVYTGEFSAMTGGVFRVGAGGLGGGSLNGQIDEFQVHNRVLSLAEAQQLYQSGQRGNVANAGDGIEINASAGNQIGGDTAAERNVISSNSGSGVNITGDGVPNDTISWWKADGNANDSIGSNHGTLQNGALTVAGGKDGSAFFFDGINDRVSIANESQFDFVEQQFSVDLWFRTSKTGALQHLISKGNGSGYQWGVRVNSANKLVAGFWDVTGNNVYAVESGSSVSDGQWHHVAVVMDTRVASESVLLYLDGIQQTNITNNSATRNYTGDAGASVMIGGRADGVGYFDGLIDDVAVYNRALTVDEMLASYRSAGGSKGGNVVSGNYIGTDVTGTRAMGNAYGIFTDSSSGNRFGGTGAGEGNLIS